MPVLPAERLTMPLGAVPQVIISPERQEGHIRYIHNVAKQLETRLPFQGPADILLTLGSGLNPLADSIEFQENTRVEINDGDIGLPVGTLEGHQNKIVAGITQKGKKVVLKVGRVHAYQVDSQGVEVPGYGVMTPEQIATAYLRVFDEIGVENVILTCAAGGIQHPLLPGDPPVFQTFPTVAIIESDIDFRYDSPLQGGHQGLGRGIRFPNWRESDSLLKQLFAQSMNDVHGNISIPHLIYGTSQTAPLFENKAIVKFYAQNGINLVGMSISPEIQVASDAKNMKRLLALAVVTNGQTLYPIAGNQTIIDIRSRFGIPLSDYEKEVIANGDVLIPSQFDLHYIPIDQVQKAPASHEEVLEASKRVPEMLVPPLMAMIDSLE